MNKTAGGSAKPHNKNVPPATMPAGIGVKMTKKKKRYYSFKVVSYAEIDEIKPLLKASEHWAYICHDKDETDKHYHILCTFSQHKSFERVRAYIQSEKNTFCQPLDDWTGDYEYLTHSNAPEKFQYNQSDIVSNDLEFWNKKSKTDDMGEDNFVEDLLSGDLSYRQMALKYGKDYMRNFKSYEYFRYAVINQEHTQALYEERVQQECNKITTDLPKIEIQDCELPQNFLENEK